MDLVSTDPVEIAIWAAQAYACGLYRSDGMMQYVFQGEGVIHKMAYLPRIAWVADATWRGWRKVHGFTHPAYRRQGHCGRLYRLVREG